MHHCWLVRALLVLLGLPKGCTHAGIGPLALQGAAAAACELLVLPVVCGADASLVSDAGLQQHICCCCRASLLWNALYSGIAIQK